MVVSTRVITCLVHHKARTRPDVICRGPRKTRPTSQRFNTRPRTVGSLSKCRKSNCPGVHRFIIRTRGCVSHASCMCGAPWIRAHGPEPVCARVRARTRGRTACSTRDRRTGISAIKCTRSLISRRECNARWIHSRVDIPARARARALDRKSRESGKEKDLWIWRR